MGSSQRGEGEGAMTSFVFYDTETTGTDTVFDQILQFAAILTDDNMRELDRFEIRCRLLPHVVPAKKPPEVAIGQAMGAPDVG